MQIALNSKEEGLVRGIRGGDEAALDTVYRRFYPMVLRFIQTNNGTEEEAKDVYQDAMLVLYEKLQDQRFMLKCQLKTFLYSVSRRLWLKKLGEKSLFSRRPEDQEDYLDVGEDTREFEEKTLQFEQMASALEQLGEPCRTLIGDFYLRNLTMDEIAEKFGYTNADNAKTQKYKCLKRLKTFFFKNYR